MYTEERRIKSDERQHRIVFAKFLSTISTKYVDIIGRVCGDNMPRHGESFDPTMKQVKNIADSPTPWEKKNEKWKKKERTLNTAVVTIMKLVEIS